MYHVSFKKLPVSWILGYRRNLEVKNGAYYLKKSSNVHPVHHWTTSPTSPQLPPEIVMEKGCNFRTRPPGSTIWKGRLRYGRFFVSINCWSTSAATLFLEIQSYCWWKKEIRRSPVDDMENLPFTGFQKHLRWWSPAFWTINSNTTITTPFGAWCWRVVKRISILGGKGVTTIQRHDQEDDVQKFTQP